MDISKIPLCQVDELLKCAQGKERENLLRLLAEDKRKGIKRLLASHKAAFLASRKAREEFKKLSFLEKDLRRRGVNFIAGVDESGRGALAGPLVAAAVILSEDTYIPGLRECKQVSPRFREELYTWIMEKALDVSVALLSNEEVDKMGIQKANKYVLTSAVKGLKIMPDYILVDGFPLTLSTIPHRAVLKGDRLSVSIAAASIVSKVTRDKLMEKYHLKYPHYGFKYHKGYGTARHLEALLEYGPSPIHRFSFEPVRRAVEGR